MPPANLIAQKGACAKRPAAGAHARLDGLGYCEVVTWSVCFCNPGLFSTWMYSWDNKISLMLARASTGMLMAWPRLEMVGWILYASPDPSMGNEMGRHDVYNDMESLDIVVHRLNNILNYNSSLRCSSHAPLPCSQRSSLQNMRWLCQRRSKMSTACLNRERLAIRELLVDCSTLTERLATTLVMKPFEFQDIGTDPSKESTHGGSAISGKTHKSIKL